MAAWLIHLCSRQHFRLSPILVHANRVAWGCYTVHWAELIYFSIFSLFKCLCNLMCRLPCTAFLEITTPFTSTLQEHSRHVYQVIDFIEELDSFCTSHISLNQQKVICSKGQPISTSQVHHHICVSHTTHYCLHGLSYPCQVKGFSSATCISPILIR